MYFGLRRRKVFVEYVLLAGVNDSPDDARLLARLPGREMYKVNLIPYNPTGRYDGSARPVIAAFKAELDRSRVPATVRLTRGRDIEAACGQLAVSRRSNDLILRIGEARGGNDIPPAHFHPQSPGVLTRRGLLG